MSDTHNALARIAAALERLAPDPQPTPDWTRHAAYVWDGTSARAARSLEAPSLDQMRGIDAQKATVVENVARLASGAAAHDMLLWGARGMGKSALVRAAVIAAQATDHARIALVQIASEGLESLPRLFGELGPLERSFLLFIDDIGFDRGEDAEARHLRSWLEGGVDARPANLRFAVTSNRRAIVSRSAAEQDDPLNPRDAVDDRLALADRFGLSIGFHNCDQPLYLEIVGAYADPLGLEWDETEALEWAKRRGARSGRTAWQFVTELAGRAGRRL